MATPSRPPAPPMIFSPSNTTRRSGNSRRKREPAMKYYATRTEQAAHGMPERVTVYRFDSKSDRAFFLKYGERYDYDMHPRPICEAITAKQARALAMVDQFGDKYVYEHNTGTVYPYGTPGHDAYTLDYFTQHPATIPTDRDVADLARLDMELLRTVRSAINDSPSQFAPAARERIDAILATQEKPQPAAEKEQQP